MIASGLLHYARAQQLYQAMARYEMGADYAVDPTLIRRGMVMEAQDYLTDKGPLALASPPSPPPKKSPCFQAWAAAITASTSGSGAC